MKRPIAELLTLTLRSDAEAERRQCDRELWQILSRKQGYVTHHLYRRADAPQQWLAYSEWESRKLLDGARQQLKSTPLVRRARATLAEPAVRRIVELVGARTSTKGLDLPDDAVGVLTQGQLENPGDQSRSAEEAWWKQLAAQAGYVTHVLFRDLTDPAQRGAVSHWHSRAAFDAALAAIAPADGAGAIAPRLTAPLQHTIYLPLRP